MITPEDNVKYFMHAVLTWKMTETDGMHPNCASYYGKERWSKTLRGGKVYILELSTVITNLTVPKLLSASSYYNKHLLSLSCMYVTTSCTQGRNRRNYSRFK